MSRLSDPNLKEPIYSVGLITLSMSFADYMIENLVELYLGESTARAVINELGRNRDKSSLLRSLIGGAEADTDLSETLLVCLDAYAIHRENRNKLAHAYSVATLDDGSHRWERASGKIHPPIAASVIKPDALEIMIDQLEKLNAQLTWAMMYKAQELGYRIFKGSIQIGRPSRPPLPGKFPEIDPLTLEASLTMLQKRDEIAPPSDQSG